MNRMRLKILVPSGVLLEEEIVALRAEGGAGHFGLLPRHIDMVADLVPGILAYRLSDEDERFAAVDEGILLKQGHEVTVSAFSAVVGKKLGQLRKTVEDEFLQLDDYERKSRSVLAMLEGAIIRRVTEDTEFESE